jgi:hypothetical protein
MIQASTRFIISILKCGWFAYSSQFRFSNAGGLAEKVQAVLRSPKLLVDLTIDWDKLRSHLKIADFGRARLLNRVAANHIN